MPPPPDEAPRSDHPQFAKEQPSRRRANSMISTQPSESRSTATTTSHPTRQDSLDAKLATPHTGDRGRDSKKDLPDTSSDISTTTTATDRQRAPSAERRKARSGRSNSVSEETLKRSSSDPLESGHGAPQDREQSINPSSNLSRSATTRLPLNPKTASYAQVTRTSKESLQHPQGATGDTSARGSAAYRDHPSHAARRPQDAQAPQGHLSENVSEQQEIKQPPQVSGYGIMDTLMSIIPTGGPPTPKDKYTLLKEEYQRTRDELRHARAALDNYDRELRRKNGELRYAGQVIGHHEHEIQRSKDFINGLKNELSNVHQQLEDAKNLSEVRGKELFGAQVFLTKADTLSISEVGDKVTALNEEIFQAAATLGDALIHKRHELSQTDFEAAAVDSQEMVGEKLTNILITQSQKPEPEVNPLLVQVVLQIFMVKFCVSKIQSWYPGDSGIGDFLSAIYSEIRSSEEQAVSGRWRALTRTHTRPSTETWKEELYQKLQSVLVVASWAAQSSEHEDSYGHRLPSIFKAINELRMAIGEKFTSADLDIYVFKCDENYDPATMDDAYSDGRRSSSKRASEAIVGTTGIGLVKLLVERNAKDAIQLQMMISPKIVLKSTLNEALEPQTSRFSRLKKKKKPLVETADGTQVDPEARGAGSRSESKAGTNVDMT